MEEKRNSLKSYYNKAVYTATCVAGGWAGAEMPICTPKAKQYRRTDRPTDQPTDRPTDRVSYRSRCPRQKQKGTERKEERKNIRESPIGDEMPIVVLINDR